MSRKKLNLIGQQFGRLTVAEEAKAYRSPGGQIHRQWTCVCSCGEQSTVRQQHLRNGHTTSCGCASREEKTTHGMSDSPAYRSWRCMMSRCYNDKDIGWKSYGGRGIKVCDEWHDFLGFVADMGQPLEGMSIDRVNTDGDYAPGNCRWADRVTQSNNKRNNRRIAFDGEEKTLTEWARKIEVSPETLKRRLDKGWPIDRALSTPVGETTELMLQTVRKLHKSGDEHKQAKMTFRTAEKMREYKRENPEVTDRDLGNQFGVGRETARKVIRRLAW